MSDNAFLCAQWTIFPIFVPKKKPIPPIKEKETFSPPPILNIIFFLWLTYLRKKKKKKSKSRLLFFLNTLYLCIAFSQYYLTTQLCITYLFKEEKTNMKSKLLVVLCEQNTYLLLVMTIKMRYTRCRNDCQNYLLQFLKQGVQKKLPLNFG